MKLKEFVEKYVYKNTLIRLWIPMEDNKNGFIMIREGDNEVCMEHALLNDRCFQSKYKDCEFIGVTDIYCEQYREAVNIIIDPSNKKDLPVIVSAEYPEEINERNYKKIICHMSDGTIQYFNYHKNNKVLEEKEIIGLNYSELVNIVKNIWNTELNECNNCKK